MENELKIPQKCTISVPENADIVIQTAANAFIEFMQTQMQVSLTTGCDGFSVCASMKLPRKRFPSTSPFPTG